MTDIVTPYNERQAAKYVGTSETTLRIWRYEGKGPRWYRPGAKLVRSRKADLDEWINARLMGATANVAQ